MTWRLLLLALVLVTMCGCAGTQRTAPSSASESPRVRCLSNPHETGTRPLIFLLCVESP
jgi:hypothetical protein